MAIYQFRKRRTRRDNSRAIEGMKHPQCGVENKVSTVMSFNGNHDSLAAAKESRFYPAIKGYGMSCAKHFELTSRKAHEHFAMGFVTNWLRASYKIHCII